MGTKLVVVLVVVAFLAGLGVGFVAFRPTPETPSIIWSSTQLAPPGETEFVIKELLPTFEQEFGVRVTFVPEQSYATFEDRLLSEVETGNVRVTVAGGLHGDFSLLTERGFLQDLTDVSLPDRTFIPSLRDLSMTDGQQFYVPWMQATYLMVVNTQALPYLPDGADVNALTYDDLLAWAQNIATNTEMDTPVGIPAGPGSLIHRFVHGYLYPSFTGTTVADFNSPEAVSMWQFVRDLWPYVHPSAPTWDAMATHLLDESVWIAWDHQARFSDAITTRPNDFQVIPSPAGSEGRGFISVAAGLAIPVGAPNRDIGVRLIEYLTRPSTQRLVAENVGFFPTVQEATGEFPEGALRNLAQGISAQAAAPDAIVALIPGGLGGRAGEFSDIYRTAFQRIVIGGQDIQTVLDDLEPQLLELFEDTGAPYPQPG